MVPRSLMSTIEELKKAALEYHRKAPAGKIKVTPTKPVVTQRELSLAYSPEVTFALTMAAIPAKRDGHVHLRP